MLKFISKLFGGTKSDKEVKKAQEIVEEINSIFDTLSEMSDEELRAKTNEFKVLIQNSTVDLESEKLELENKLVNDILDIDEIHETNTRLKEIGKELYSEVQEVLDGLLPEAYAVVKEVCNRLTERKHSYKYVGNESVWAMVPFDVQLIGGIMLHNGKISEMQTGEGKTLVAIMPLYLNSLAGKGVHLVTVNDYLARRDCEWMKPVFDFLGINVGYITSNMDNEDRKDIYNQDITYGTNNEFGFDYLRDNMVTDIDDMVQQRGHWYAVVDEVDSVLIDEARTPLIISGPVSHSAQKFDEIKPRVKRLVDSQIQLVNKIVAEAASLLAENKKENKETIGLALLRATHGLPKHKRLMKLMQDADAIRLKMDSESFYMRDQSRHMHEVDDELYYTIDEKSHHIDITEKGRDLLCNDQEDSEMFLLPDIASELSFIEGVNDMTPEEKQMKKDAIHVLYSERSDRIHTISQILRAYSLYEKDVEYVVQEGKVMIVDEHTGRILDGRRYSDGLHQAIEAKENVMVEKDTQTMATITLQNYFRLYNKLSGMTGTAETEAPEFEKIYNLEVVTIPTNRPLTRQDLNDVMYKTKRAKYNAIVEETNELLQSGRAVLVGTATVEVSEVLSRMFRSKGIPHNVLNAKQHAKEAEIVAEAGRKGAVTIATNMAGRGTDIKIDEVVRQAGGLAIIGTERHDSRRIDRQLRGRSGRQGDPGSSKFYISLEDNLIRLFGNAGDKLAKRFEMLGISEEERIEHSLVTGLIENAQKKVEENNFGIRKRLIDYDDVMNQQREVIYTRRRHALKGERLRGEILGYVEDIAVGWYQEFHNATDINYTEMINTVRASILVEIEMTAEQFHTSTIEQFIEAVLKAANDFYDRKESSLSEEFMRQLEKVAVLQTIDDKWKEHLREMDDLKEGIYLRSYGQKDPLLEYKQEAFNLFENLVYEINKDSINFVFKYFPQVIEREVPTKEQKQAAIKQAPVLTNTNVTRGLQFQHSEMSQFQYASNEPEQERPAQKAERQEQAIPTFKREESKIGRNDVVSVRYANGEVKKDKYKKLEKDVQDGKCIIL